MPRLTVLFLISAVVLVSGVVGGMRAPVVAQDSTPAATADQAIVGGWRCQTDAPRGSFTSFALFHPDGTFVEEVFYGVTFLGVWQATGERTVDLNLFATDVDPAEDVILMGEGRLAIEVGETGDAFDMEGIFQGQDPDGTVLFTEEGLKSHCTRLPVSPLAAMGTPAATPTA